MMTTSNTKVTVRFRSSVVMLSDVSRAASCWHQWRQRGAEGGPGGGRLGERGQRQTRTGLVIRVQVRLGDTTVLMDRRSGSMGGIAAGVGVRVETGPTGPVSRRRRPRDTGEHRARH